MAMYMETSLKKFFLLLLMTRLGIFISCDLTTILYFDKFENVHKIIKRNLYVIGIYRSGLLTENSHEISRLISPHNQDSTKFVVCHSHDLHFLGISHILQMFMPSYPVRQKNTLKTRLLQYFE